jgi:hypothetical protein
MINKLFINSGVLIFWSRLFPSEMIERTTWDRWRDTCRNPVISMTDDLLYELGVVAWTDAEIVLLFLLLLFWLEETTET